MAAKMKIDYTVDRGELWERLIVIKDRRSHRKRIPTAVAASISIAGTAYVIPTEITSEGAVLMTMTANNTEWLTDGTYNWDMVATVPISAYSTSSPVTEMVVVAGEITVSTYANITPMASDGVATALTAVS